MKVCARCGQQINTSYQQLRWIIPWTKGINDAVLIHDKCLKANDQYLFEYGLSV